MMLEDDLLEHAKILEEIFEEEKHERFKRRVLEEAERRMKKISDMSPHFKSHTMMKLHIKKFRKVYEERIPYFYVAEIDSRETSVKLAGIRSEHNLYVGDLISAHMTPSTKYKNFLFDEFVSLDLHLLIRQIKCSGQFKERFIMLISKYLIRHIRDNVNICDVVRNIKYEDRPKGISILNLNRLKKLLIVDEPIHNNIVKNVDLTDLVKLPTYVDLLTCRHICGHDNFPLKCPYIVSNHPLLIDSLCSLFFALSYI